MNLNEWVETELQRDIWYKKYQMGNETFDEWLDRVSGGNEEVRRLIVEKKFLFGGRILANRGVDGDKVTYSNCFALDQPEDSIEGIFNTAMEAARTFSYGGGVGINISSLSPRGAKVRNAAKTTSGAVSFAELFDKTAEMICQNGRRGALMLAMDISHPDIEEFIDLKSDVTKATKANTSVLVTDEFMNAVGNDGLWELRYEREETGEVISKTVKAKELFHKIAKRNWETGEPGLLFYDEINDNHFLWNYDDVDIKITNPCGEVPMMPNDSCLLGSVNLSEFVGTNGITLEPFFKMQEFKHTVRVAIAALNEVQEEGIKKLPLEKQRQIAKDYRRIGLGIMGLADMLIKMRLKYDTGDARELCGTIMGVMQTQAIQESELIAVAKGKFPKWEDTAPPMYNSALLSIAPTGTLSTLLGVSGGAEPIYDLSYTRKTESLNGEDKYYKVYTPIVKQYMEQNSLKDESELPDYFITAKQISYKNRIFMQSALQLYVDQGISSTINLPEQTTIEQIEELYMTAWSHDLKGITVFRDNCARTGILTSKPKGKPQDQIKTKAIETPKNAVGKKRKLMTGCGSLHCVGFFDKETGRLLETFLNKGSTGGCNQFMNGLSRVISLAARSGSTIFDIIDQLDSTGVCPSYAVRTAKYKDTSPGSCCPKAVGKALMEMYEEMQNEIEDGVYYEDILEDSQEIEEEYSLDVIEMRELDEESKCPECGEPLQMVGGCNGCPNCGWSKCN